MPAVLSKTVVGSDTTVYQGLSSGKHEKTRGKTTARSGGRGIGYSDGKKTPGIQNENTGKTPQPEKATARRKYSTPSKASTHTLSASTVLKAGLLGVGLFSVHIVGSAPTPPPANGTIYTLTPFSANKPGRFADHSTGDTTQICTQSQVLESKPYLECNNQVKTLIRDNATNAVKLEHCLKNEKTCNYNVLQKLDEKTVIDYSRNQLGGCNQESALLNQCNNNQTLLIKKGDQCKLDLALKLEQELELENKLAQCKQQQEQQQEQCKQQQEQCKQQQEQCKQEQTQSQSSLGLPFWLLLGVALGSAVCTCGVCAMCKKDKNNQNCLDKLTRQSQKLKKTHHDSVQEMREIRHPLRSVNQSTRRGSSSF